MDYIYAELNKTLLPNELPVFYGLNVDRVVTKLPMTALEVTQPEKLRINGTYEQLYSLSEYDQPKYPYFAYPARYGALSFIAGSEGLINEIKNWDVNIIEVNKNKYYLWCYKGMLAPCRSSNIIFKIKK